MSTTVFEEARQEILEALERIQKSVFPASIVFSPKNNILSIDWPNNEKVIGAMLHGPVIFYYFYEESPLHGIVGV